MRALVFALLMVAAASSVQAQAANKGGGIAKGEEIEAGISAETLVLRAGQEQSGLLTFFGVAPVLAGRRDVVIELIGPARTRIVRRKAKVAGVWINDDSWRVSDAPGYYGVAKTATAPMPMLPLSPDSAAAREPAVGAAIAGSLRAEGLTPQVPVRFLGSTLFAAAMPAPANAPPGAYLARFTLLEDGRPIAQTERTTHIATTGTLRALTRMARESSLLYGLLAVALAALAALLANLLVGMFRRLAER